MSRAVMKRICLLILGCIMSLEGYSQFTYGTTGLLHAPSADMQRDKTFMAGAGYLNSQATPARWDYHTWNYYVNITFFPWLEVAYTCTIFDEWVGSRKVHMKNQDRNFSARLRLWKEGWWKSWTPQIVAGVNDPGTSAHDDGWGDVKKDGNGFFNRYYVAATKHFNWYGVWGIHAAYVYNKHLKNKLNGPTFGVDYRFNLPQTSFFNKMVNGINLIAEYDSKFVNIGGRYSIWKDHINLVGELRDCKHPSVGVYFKVHL